MTATLNAASRGDALSERLAVLRRQRDDALAEIAPNGRGDDADRATNVDAHVRLGMLEKRIADLDYELTDNPSNAPHDDGSVAIGSLVTLDFGDGPERYLFASLDHAADGLDVITPGSPLGRALLGAKVGSVVSYEARGRVRLDTTVVAVG